MAPTGQAAAFADPGLSGLILTSPETGWLEAPASSLQAIVARLQKIDTNAAQGQSVEVAAKLWRSPDDKQLLGITLSKWPSDIGNLDQAAKAGLNDECVSVTGNDPGSVEEAPGIAGSYAGVCPASSPTGNSLAVVVVRKGDYVALVEDIGVGTSPLGLSEIESVASRQNALLPAPAASAAPAIAGVLGLLVVFGLIALFVTRSRRSHKGRHTASRQAPLSPTPYWQTPPPPPPGSGQGLPPPWPAPAAVPGDEGAFSSSGPRAPTTLEGVAYSPVPSVAPSPERPSEAVTGKFVGWHGEKGDQSVLRYWDGSSWSARKQWDGTAWVPVAASAEPDKENRPS
jgi:hypothetical protein